MVQIREYFLPIILNAIGSKQLANPSKDSCSRKELLYGGITNNILRNLSRYNIDKYVVRIFVDSFLTAEKVEKELDRMDVYIGERGEYSAGNGGANEESNNDSRVGYVADRTIIGFKD